MGSMFKMSTSFQPQMDGQTERVNLVIQQFLRNYLAVDQQDCRNPSLGSRPRQGGCKGAGQKEARESHQDSRECKKV